MKDLFVLVADEDMRQTLMALLGELAKRTTWRHCRCPAFAELKHHLQRWFG